MKTDFTHLPIIFYESKSYFFRWVHLIVSVPLFISFFVEHLSTHEIIQQALVILLFSGFGEWFQYLITRNKGVYRISLDGVSFKNRKTEWYEPLSAYKDVYLCETISSGSLYGSSMDWHFELRHALDSQLSITFSDFFFGPSHEASLLNWTELSNLLGMPRVKTLNDRVTSSHFPSTKNTPK